MIETFQLRDLMPVARVMARLASRLETPLVRILVACRAFCEREACVFHVRFSIRYGRVALGTWRFLMGAGQWIFCFGMMKERCRLPVLRRMAAGTIIAKLTAVFVLVAACTRARKAQISAVEVFDDDAHARRGRNVLRPVALFTCDASVLSRKGKARFAMVHRLALRFPVD